MTNNKTLKCSGIIYLLAVIFIFPLILYFWSKTFVEINLIIRDNVKQVTCIKTEDISTSNIPKIIRTYSDGYSDRSAYFQRVKKGEVVEFYLGFNGKRFLRKNAVKVIVLDFVLGLLVFQLVFYFYLCYKETSNFEKYHKRRIRFKKTIPYL